MRNMQIRTPMRSIEVSGEVLLLFAIVFSLIQCLLMGAVIKLLWDMRSSGWSVQKDAKRAAKGAEQAALKCGYTERRIMSYCYAGQFNNWELVRQIMSLFWE